MTPPIPLLKPSAITRLLRVATSSLGVLPLGLRIKLGRAVGKIVSFVPSTDRSVAQAQIDAFLPTDRRPTVTEVYANAGQTICESFNLRPYLKHPQHRISFEKRDQIIAWLADSRPLIALPCHSSNWDLLAAVFISNGIPVTTTGRQAQAASIQDFLVSFRESYGVKTIWRGAKTGDRGQTRELIRDMKKHRCVATMLDQDTHVDSVFIPFLGTPAATPCSLVKFGQRMNARFITAFMIRSACHTKYTVIADEIPAELDTEGILKTYNQRLEQLLLQHPEQWVWFHKRWRTLPQGKRLSTREYLQELKRRAEVGIQPEIGLKVGK